MLDDSQFYLIAFVPEESVHHSEQILFSETLTEKLGDLMKTFTQSYLQAFIVGLEESLVDFPQVRFPPLPSYRIQDSWEVVGTAVDDLIFLAETVDLCLGHSAELPEEFHVELVPDQVDEGAKMLVG